jgi:CheY-like chemotaxis protein
MGFTPHSCSLLPFLLSRAVNLFELLHRELGGVREPDSPGGEPASADCEEISAAPDSSLSVLMIEDDGNDQALFTFAAERSGLDICLHVVATAQEGIEFLKRTDTGGPDIDLVLLDLVMPGDSGFDFLEWWAESPWRCIPVAVLSGSTYPVEQSAAVELGATAFLTKPSSLEEWQQTVREVCELASGPRE